MPVAIPVPCQSTNCVQISHTSVSSEWAGRGVPQLFPHLPPPPSHQNPPASTSSSSSNYVYHHKPFTLSPHPYKILWDIYIFLLLELEPSTVVTEILCKSNPVRNLYPTPLHHILLSINLSNTTISIPTSILTSEYKPTHIINPILIIPIYKIPPP